MSGTCRCRRQGFTLIEVMITVTVVAILAGVALPAYTEYLRRGQTPEAFTHLADYRVKLEHYYQDYRNYGNAGGTTCANGTNAPSWNTFVPAQAKYFSFTCALTGSTDNQGYVLTATGKAGTRVAGYTYTLGSDGARATTQFKGATVNKNCWAVKAGDC